jgi:creatinine amidohydrolase
VARFTDLTFEEIAAAAREGAIAAVPAGCTEQQGPHLTVGFDSWFAQELLEAGADRAEADGIRVVVLPAMPFGPTPEHRGYGAGYVDLPPALHDAVVEAVLGSLADQGFGRILVWRGCGGHDLRATVTRFNHGHSGTATAYLPGHPFHDIWCAVADPGVPGGHADSFTTSVALFRHPELVRTDRVPTTPSAQPDWDDPELDFTRYSTTGVIGDARHASAELGARLWEECVDAVAERLRTIARQPDEVPIEPTM